MGEEGAGVDAVRVTHSRIVAGQSDIGLVGGAHNGERRDLLLIYSAGGHALKDRFAPVWERADRGGGIVLGSMGAFLVLESREHAEARRARPLARLTTVLSEQSRRRPGAVTAALARMWQTIGPNPEKVAVISGATGAEPATNEERTWLNTLVGVPVRATGTHIGHGSEPQFAMNIALATLALGHRRLFPPADAGGVEHAVEAPVDQVVVTGVGHWRGEGMALVESVR
jgi:3-oxoacyl-[acyl-carrier-protein] synthase II